MMILGCPPKSKNIQKGTLGGSRCGQKGIKRGCKKEQPETILAHYPPSKKRTSVAKRNPSRKASMLLSHKDYYCFLTGLSATGPRKTVCGIKFLTTFSQKEVHFGTPFFSLSAPWVPKRGPEENRWPLVGSPGRFWRLKKSFLEGSEIGTKTEPKKYPKMRASRRPKT